MNILVNNPVQATIIFSAILLVGILVSIRWRKDQGILSPDVSQELKGVAILLVVFSHIGYFLASDTRFLFPLSIAAGVGVNMFLFLSGYGLTISSTKSDDTILQNYRRRLGKLYVPMWITGIIFVILDLVLLGKTYQWQYLMNSALGFFSSVNLYADLNSPLWYFTLIIFYYLLFPVVFFKKLPWLSALVLYLVSYLIVNDPPSIIYGVVHMYKIHLIAFPLGMIFAWILAKPSIINIFTKINEKKYWLARVFLVLLSIVIAVYTAFHSNVGLGIREELMSMVTVLALSLIFILKKVSFKSFYWIGFFSYEIYLLHWPIMYRFDFLYKYTPSWLATALYLLIFIGLGWVLQLVTGLILKKKKVIAK
ncbi:MAG: acyltransferase family protein [Patescibacteria group bacterium]